MKQKERVVMPVYVHPIKAALWRVGSSGQIEGKHSLREIGAMIGEEHPQEVKHHLEGLVKMGAIDFIGGEYRWPVGSLIKS